MVNLHVLAYSQPKKMLTRYEILNEAHGPSCVQLSIA